MKPARFKYECVRDVAEALTLLAQHGADAKVLAGGQSLVPLLNMRLARPSVVVDINRIAGLGFMRADSGYLAIGAVARDRDVELWTEARQRCAILVEALRHVGHAEIRHRGTVCGSLAHSDPAAELPVLALALDAELVARSVRGVRTIPAERFFVSMLTTALEADELLVEARLPVLPRDTGWAFLELARRQGDFAIAMVAVLLERGVHGRCARARVVLGGVDATPIRARAAEGALIDQPLVAARFAEAARAAVGPLRPRAMSMHPASTGRRSPRCSSSARSWRPVAACRRATDMAVSSRHEVTVHVNGVDRSATVESRRSLADFLRHDLGLTGTHVGCEHGACGACTVMVDSRSVRSCLMLAVQADGSQILTIEGLAENGALGPLQQAFWEHQGLQCGFCTPGMLMVAERLLRENPAPTADEVREAIAANICRCTGYQDIVAAVLAAAAARRERAGTRS